MKRWGCGGVKQRHLWTSRGPASELLFASTAARHRRRSNHSTSILVPEGTKMSALTVQVLRLSLSLGSVTAPTRIPPFCAYGAGKLDCECIHARLSLS